MTRDLIFYDGDCPLCNRSIRFILKVDKKKRFFFAPLGGATAREKISTLHLENPHLDTLILYEARGKIWTEGRGVLRILWLLGGQYAWVGWLFILPSSLFNVLYRFVAKRRYRIFATKLPIHSSYSDRFLP